MEEEFVNFYNAWLREVDNVTCVCNSWANDLVDYFSFFWTIVVGERSGVFTVGLYFRCSFLREGISWTLRYVYGYF